MEDRVLRSIEAGCGHLLGHCETDTIGHTLAERAGSRLDTGSLMELRVTRSDAVELTEFLNLIE